MTVLIITFVLSALFWLLQRNFWAMFIIVVLMVVKGYRCNEKGLPLSSVYNMDKKITRVYKNDIFELASTLIIFYVTLEGFNPEVFIGSLDIPAAILLFIVTFLFIIRTSEEKIFDARDVEG